MTGIRNKLFDKYSISYFDAFHTQDNIVKDMVGIGKLTTLNKVEKKVPYIYDLKIKIQNT